MTDRQDTSPGTGPVPSGGATAYGGTAPDPAPDPAPATTTAPDYSPRPVAVRRADVLGALLLLLAGVAAAVSLLLRWIPGEGTTGIDLVRRGFTELGDGVGGLLDTGFWQPLAVVLGGAVLFVLGLLLLLPAKRHRLVGLLALLVVAVVAAGVLVPLAQAGFAPDTFRIGFWFAVATAVLGLLGALKALVTGPRTARH